MFVSNTRFRIISHEDDFDAIFCFKTRDCVLESVYCPRKQLFGPNEDPNFNLIYGFEDQPCVNNLKILEFLTQKIQADWHHLDLAHKLQELVAEE